MSIRRLIRNWFRAAESWIEPPSSGRNVTGLAMDLIESLADETDDPEMRAAGSTEPHYAVSEQVSYSRDHGLYVYHCPDDQLGLGSSLGNALAMAETKGTGEMQNFFSIEAGLRVMGGMSIAYLVPFSDLSSYGKPLSPHAKHRQDLYARMMSSTIGTMHLHPAFQQHEFVIGDGLHVLETFFLPRIGMDDPAAAYAVIVLSNRTPHPLGITVVASQDLRGETARDLQARYEPDRGALMAWNRSKPDWVRVFGAGTTPKGYLVTTDEETAYSPGQDLPNRIEDTGDLTGALQVNVLLQPGQQHKLRFVIAFSAKGQREALKAYDRASARYEALRETIRHYSNLIEAETIEMPDVLLTQGVQWAKACLLRPLSRYAVGTAITNDPGNSTHLVGRDTAWYVYGTDFVDPDAACGLLEVFARRQRKDGLIAEYIDGNTGESEFHGFNINDNTPLFVIAVAHHVKASGHMGCLRELYDAAKRAGDLILRVRDKRGLVRCTANGLGVKGICGWRNVLQYEQINGEVTEVNSECYAALLALGDLSEMYGRKDEAARYREEARRLKEAINQHLINPDNGLYVRNVDLEGHVFTQATVDLVFPLIAGVADEQTSQAIGSRLREPDFMTEGGIRALPEANPHYHPSSQSGCLGGVWPGATWWYAMGQRHIRPDVTADSLRKSYWHYIADPKTYNTVPGQFSEWSDGQTLVNRGMRLSPWEAPRFLWVAIEGLAGITLGCHSVSLDPHIPSDWRWLRVSNLPYRDTRLNFFLTRQNGELHVYTCDRYEGGHIVQHRYDQELRSAASVITAGLSITGYRKGEEILICLGSSLDVPALGPFVAHHALGAGRRYHVHRLNSDESDWRDLGIIKGSQLQRITARLEPRGYSLYRFLPVR